jgi:hypothetical protein
MSEIIHINGVKTNEAYTFYVTLAETGDLDERITNPAIVAGDVRVSTDGGAFANAGTLPTVDPAGDKGVLVTLSAAEMNGTNILVCFEDATAPEVWEALTVSIHTYAADQDDLVRSTTPANSLDVSATGEAGLDFDNIKDATGAHTLTNITVPTVTTLTGHTVQTGDSFARLGAPAGASVSADVAAIKAETVLIVADTNELQTDWVNAGRLDTILDAIAADAASLDDTKIPNTISLAAINAEVDTALNTAIPGGPTADSINERIKAIDVLTEASGDGDLAAVLADTAELQGDWVNAGRLDVILDAILADTGTDGVQIDLTQAYTEGQTARTTGGSLEMAEAIQRNLITDAGAGGNRILYESDGTTALVTRAHTTTALTP